MASIIGEIQVLAQIWQEEPGANYHSGLRIATSWLTRVRTIAVL